MKLEGFKNRMRKMINVEVDGKIVRASHGSLLLHTLLDHQISINHSCGGHGTCGTCRVFVESTEPLPERDFIEAEMAGERSFSAKERLSCQLEVHVPMKVKVP